MSALSTSTFSWLQYRNPPWGVQWFLHPRDWFFVAITPIIKSFLTISAGSRLIRFAISATVIPSVYSNSVGNSWNLRSVTGFGAWIAVVLFIAFFFLLFIIPVTISLISHLILTTSILLVVSRTIFFAIIIVTFFIWSSLFLRRVSTAGSFCSRETTWLNLLPCWFVQLV